MCVLIFQSKKCVCLRDVHLQRIVPSDKCNFKCENEYSKETSIKFSKECGGENTYNVFKSGMSFWSYVGKHT